MSTRTTVQITMPEMGDSVSEGVILEWRKQEGDAVSEGETIVEISTDKVDAEVPAPASGTLAKILAQPDETVSVGAVLGEISLNGEAAPAAAGDAGNGAGAAAPSADGGDAATMADEGGATADEAADIEAGHTPPDTVADAAGDGAAGDGAAGELIDVKFPEMGDSVSEGTILEWKVAVGDTVELDQEIVEISTDKVDAEMPSPVAGVVEEILAQADETVSVGSVLCRIRQGADPPAGAAPEAPEAAEAPAPARAAPGGDANGADATPVAARMAAEAGIDLSEVPGSGPRGRVTKSDVQAALEGNGASAAAPAKAGTTPIRGPAAALARFMNESRSIPTATSFRTLQVATLDAKRKELKSAGKKLSFTHLIAWAIVEAARDFPVMAHAYAEEDGKPQRVDPGGVSLGLAVDVERPDGTRSLVVPVIRDAHALDFPSFVARYDALVAGARDNELKPDDYQGANITLTNPGGLGTVASVPRLMPGQGTIVATGSIAFPPGFAEVDPVKIASLGVTKVMTMTSTYDHRVIQGAESGSFLRRIDQLLQGEDEFYERAFEALGVTAEATAAAAGITAEEPIPSDITPGVGRVDEALLQAVQAATSVVKAHRMHGHLAARLDPLGIDEPDLDPALDPETVSLTPELMEQIPAAVLRVAVPGETFAEALPYLRDTYCGTIAYEIEHISDHEERVWLRQTIEWGEHRKPLDTEERKRTLRRLSEVEALETYLHKAYLGKKQFSIEGLDVLVPMIDETIEVGAAAGAREVIIGMAHRGRLNVLAHSVGRPYGAILVEFEGEQKNLKADTAAPEGGTGDVKYHYGAAGTYKTLAGKGVTVTLSPNPSHLEYVNPVIEGRVRADQTTRKGREFHHDASGVVPLIIHGDAAFPGQGVVAETLNLQALPGYSTGGTIHVIANNQVGFTTNPSDARSTRYASDLAKGFDIPIIHVNADDVEACIAAVRIAMAFRERFSKDALIDLIGYRRFGHNETDEPAYTQPQMYDVIKRHPPVRTLYANQLIERGVLSKDEADAMAERAYGNLQNAHADLKESLAQGPDTGEFQLDRSASAEPMTGVQRETLTSLNEQLLRVPEGFNIHRKLRPQLERRREAVGPDGGIDWAQAEALAYASLLMQGVPIRLTGQDTERGTFSQRHLVFHDAKTGARCAPIQRLKSATAPMELHNSPLSEVACLGFEYGYSVQAPDALVLWEAQFGDFVNSAQVILDQFIVAGEQKWGQTSRLTLLLPHGYEGSGPEHSSARIERFLELAAEGNIRIANPTTPAQYFHLLRRQALVSKRRPLVVMTPKSLLRSSAATSRLDHLADGRFNFVLDDPGAPGDREEVTRLLMCSGKIFYELSGHELRPQQRHVAIGRVELLYPFAKQEVTDLVQGYPNLRQVMWVQEEPRNMGARSFMKPRILEIIPEGVEYGYVGRDMRASASEGYTVAHRAEQQRIVSEALELGR